MYIDQKQRTIQVAGGLFYVSGHEEEVNTTQRKLGIYRPRRGCWGRQMPGETGGVEDHSLSRAPTGEVLNEDTQVASPRGSLPTAVGRALARGAARVPRQTLGRCSKSVVVNLPNSVTL